MDAVECLLSTDLDVLVMHDSIVRKRWTYRVFSPLLRFATLAHRNLRSEAMMEWFARQMLDKS